MSNQNSPQALPLRRFPSALRSMRMRRGTRQKSLAVDLGIGAPLLCAIENGTRAPLSDEQLAQAGTALSLDEAELAQLRSMAHHDRLIHVLELGGASVDELQLFSSSLTAFQHMSPQQQAAWLRNVSQLADQVAQTDALIRRQTLEPR